MHSARDVCDNQESAIELAVAASPQSWVADSLPGGAGGDRLTSPESWSRALLETQSAVAAAGSDLRRVMNAVCEGALRVMPHVIGAIVEIRQPELPSYRAASGVGIDSAGMPMRTSGSL